MMTFDKLKANPEIVERNLVLFARFIKFETIIRNIYVRIESDRIDATRRLHELELEEKKQQESTLKPACDMSAASHMESESDSNLIEEDNS